MSTQPANANSLPNDTEAGLDLQIEEEQAETPFS
jgi:hypothetical protein